MNIFVPFRSDLDLPIILELPRSVRYISNTTTLICYLSSKVGKLLHIACAPGEDSDQAAYPRRLIRVFAVRLIVHFFTL